MESHHRYWIPKLWALTSSLSYEGSRDCSLLPSGGPWRCEPGVYWAKCFWGGQMKITSVVAFKVRTLDLLWRGRWRWHTPRWYRWRTVLWSLSGDCAPPCWEVLLHGGDRKKRLCWSMCWQASMKRHLHHLEVESELAVLTHCQHCLPGAREEKMLKNGLSCSVALKCVTTDMLLHTIKTLKIKLKSQPRWLILLMPALARQKQMDSEFRTSLL